MPVARASIVWACDPNPASFKCNFKGFIQMYKKKIGIKNNKIQRYIKIIISAFSEMQKS